MRRRALPTRADEPPRSPLTFCKHRRRPIAPRAVQGPAPNGGPRKRSQTARRRLRRHEQRGRVGQASRRHSQPRMAVTLARSRHRRSRWARLPERPLTVIGTPDCLLAARAYLRVTSFVTQKLGPRHVGEGSTTNWGLRVWYSDAGYSPPPRSTTSPTRATTWPSLPRMVVSRSW